MDWKAWGGRTLERCARTWVAVFMTSWVGWSTRPAGQTAPSFDALWSLDSVKAATAAAIFTLGLCLLATLKGDPSDPGFTG